MKVILILIILLSSSVAFAQKTTKSNKLVGTYRLKVVDNILSDSSHISLYGSNPKGLLIFDAMGNYAMQIYSSTSRTPFAANDKSKGTDAEYRAAINGSNAHYGKYLIDEKANSFILETIGATYPNWENTKRKSIFKLDGNTLNYTVHVPTTGNAVRGEVVWEKIE